MKFLIELDSGYIQFLVIMTFIVPDGITGKNMSGRIPVPIDLRLEMEMGVSAGIFSIPPMELSEILSMKT